MIGLMRKEKEKKGGHFISLFPTMFQKQRCHSPWSGLIGKGSKITLSVITVFLSLTL